MTDNNDESIDKNHIDYALLEQLVDQHPELSEQEILKRYQQHSQQATIALLSEQLDDKAQILLASALPATKNPQNTHSQAQYKIDRRIDGGGQSHVYLAHRNDGTYHKTVVIKLLNQTIEGATQKQQLMAEMQILADLRHPNIVTITDAGIDEQQRPWLMLDYIDGDHIDHYIESNPQSFEDLMNLCLKLARALRYIHQQQVVHLDIKPANVMVEIIDNQAEPIIIDFGIAITQHVQQISSPYVFATPAFAAPEQLNAKSSKTDHRSDIYAFGKLLEHLHQINAQASVTSNQVSPRSLSVLIKRCTAQSPDDRFDDMQQVIDAMETIQHQNNPNKTHKESGKWWLQVVLGATALVLLWAGFTVFWPSNNPTTKAVNQTKDSLIYWQSAEDISNQTKLIYALPSRSIEPDFKRLNNQFTQLSASLANEPQQIQSLAALPVAKAAISLNRYHDAQLQLALAASHEPQNQEVQNLTGLNSLLLYHQEAQALQQLSEPKQRQVQLLALQEKYIEPTKDRFQALTAPTNNQDLMAAGLWLHFNNQSIQALAMLRSHQESELWPVERLLLAAQVAYDLGLEKVNQNQTDQAKQYFSEALNFLNQLKSIARSHPGIQQQRCQTQSQWMQLNSPIADWKLSGCEELLVLLPHNIEANLLAASAYANLADSWVKKGHEPNQILNHSREIIQQISALVSGEALSKFKRILGQTHNTEGLWLLYSDQQFTHAFEQAKIHHEQAAELMPNDFNTRYELGMAWYHLATYSPYHPELTDQQFNHVEAIFTALLEHADANQVLVSSLVRVLTEHAYIKYQHGQSADHLLLAAEGLVNQLLTQAEDNPFTHMAAATLYWTYVDYLALQQTNPDQYLAQALAHFDLVIANNSMQWTHRYNQISAMLAAITYHLNNGNSQTSELQSVKQKLDTLATMIADEISLDSHLGYYHNMMAIDQMLNGFNPTEALKRSNIHHQQCIKSPVDSDSCFSQLATQMIIESRWKLKNPGYPMPQWDSRMLNLKQAQSKIPEHTMLQAQLGQLIYLNTRWQPGSGQSHHQQLLLAQQHLNLALTQNGLLQNRFKTVLADINQAINMLSANP